MEFTDEQLDRVLILLNTVKFSELTSEFVDGRLLVGGLEMTDWSGELEARKRSYCASFLHIGCGGAPEAYVSILIGCTVCDSTWDGTGPLGEAIAKTGEFKSLRIEL